MKLFASAVLLCAALSGCAGSSALEPPKSRPVVLDPVCGRPVDPSTPWKAIHRDQVYSFHAEPCRERFAAQPDYFAFGPYPDQGPRVEGTLALFTDPVCGRETAETRWRTEVDNRAYYFHDQECYLEFRFRPQAYGAPEAHVEAK